MTVLLIIIGISFISVFIFIRQPKFGKVPSGERLERIRQSPNYKGEAFRNLSPTPVMTRDVNFFKILKDMTINRSKRSKPTQTIPSIKSDLRNLLDTADVFVWFGHSSYFIQIDGKKILVDPVFSANASPVSFAVTAFTGSNPFSADDMPEIDYLLITHDHWDHLDYHTVLQLKTKIKKVICGLGVGAHFEYWGFDKNKIIECDWYDDIPLDKGFTLHSIPARHFSGRAFQRNKSLWMAFALQSPTMNIYMGGDGGYDDHFSKAKNKFGAFDLAILENGQYNMNWKYIHCSPAEMLQAAQDLEAKRLIAVHSSKFALALHDWDEPLKKVTEINKTFNLNLLTPKIGALVLLKEHNQTFQPWWEELP